MLVNREPLNFNEMTEKHKTCAPLDSNKQEHVNVRERYVLDTTRMQIGNTKDVTNTDLQARTLTFPLSAKISPKGSGLSGMSRLAKANIRKSASLQSSLVLSLALALHVNVYQRQVPCAVSVVMSKRFGTRHSEMTCR